MDKYTAVNISELEEFFDAILSLETREECMRFFEDICTVGETKAISQRFQVANMLYDNVTYQEICAATGASTATISRVNRCLHFGSGGYMLVLRRMKKDKHIDQNEEA